jgi:hypothetical protein
MCVVGGRAFGSGDRCIVKKHAHTGCNEVFALARFHPPDEDHQEEQAEAETAEYEEWYNIHKRDSFLAKRRVRYTAKSATDMLLTGISTAAKSGDNWPLAANQRPMAL